jgi:hypothetical protein
MSGETEPLIASPRLSRRQSQQLPGAGDSSADDRPQQTMLGGGVLGQNTLVVETPVLSLRGGIENVEVTVPGSAQAFTAHPGEKKKEYIEKNLVFFFFFFSSFLSPYKNPFCFFFRGCCIDAIGSCE